MLKRFSPIEKARDEVKIPLLLRSFITNPAAGILSCKFDTENFLLHPFLNHHRINRFLISRNPLKDSGESIVTRSEKALSQVSFEMELERQVIPRVSIKLRTTRIRAWRHDVISIKFKKKHLGSGPFLCIPDNSH